MTLDNAIQHDQRVVDGTETVTWQRGALSVSVAGAKGQPLQRSAVDSLGDSLGLESTYRSFSLPVVSLGEATPTPGDTITDAAGIRWRVLSATRMTLDTRWIAQCIEMR